MNRDRLNRLCAGLPVAFSIVALAIVAVAVTTGAERAARDEGTYAHLFQLAIAAQLPFVAGFIMTVDWRRLTFAARVLTLHAGGVALALGSVAYFRL